MKLLYVIDSLGTGGAERSTANLWYALGDAGIEFRIVVFRHRNDGIENEILNEQFPVEFIESNQRDAIRQLSLIIDEYKPDLVHSTLFTSNIRTRFAKFKSRHSFIHVESMVNCNYDSSRLKDPNVNFFKLKGYQLFDYATQLFFTDHYHANGANVARHYETALAVPKSKITIVHRGRAENIHLKNRQKIRIDLCKELDIESDALILLHVGRQEYQKAHDVLLNGLKNILSANNVVLLLAGRKGNNSELVDKLINDMDSASIRHLGHRNDIPRILAATDIFLLPSRFEGLPGSMIEAEAAGLPIVASKIPTIEEVAVNGKNAILFERDNPEELEIAVTKLIESESLRQELGKESLRIFEEKFRIDEINKKMIDMYRHLIHR